MCMKDAEFSAIVCFACFQILWWNAERSFLTPFTTPPPRLVFYVPCLSNYRSLRSKLKPCMCRISPSVFSSRKVSHKMSSGEAWFHLILVLYDKYWHLLHVNLCVRIAYMQSLHCFHVRVQIYVWTVIIRDSMRCFVTFDLSYSWHSLSNAWYLLSVCRY